MWEVRESEKREVRRCLGTRLLPSLTLIPAEAGIQAHGQEANE